MLTAASLLDLEFHNQNFLLEFHTREDENFFEEISQIIGNDKQQFLCHSFVFLIF